MKENEEKLYAKFDALDEMDQFFERGKLPNLTLQNIVWNQKLVTDIKFEVNILQERKLQSCMSCWQTLPNI